ncbi:MAG: aminodeoxychorismate/anthranilate synthase component II [Desulfobacteraceae bacterium]|nr:aminodeoxychorismate/anthranilate synthase component II [Desulfobacteraceae bacterium]
MIFVIDNYDSFTYNLVQYLRQLGKRVEVCRNDAFDINAFDIEPVSGIVVSPGPGSPESAGHSVETIRRFSGKIPILGVCLGHQAVAYSFGGKIVPAKKLMHGKVSTVTTDGKTIFSNIKKPFSAMRYHSLAVDRESLPECLEVSAESEDGEIMGLRHRRYVTEGIQFHPESIMTQAGKRILRNFLKLCHSEEK